MNDKFPKCYKKQIKNLFHNNIKKSNRQAPRGALIKKLKYNGGKNTPPATVLGLSKTPNGKCHVQILIFLVMTIVLTVISKNVRP